MHTIKVYSGSIWEKVLLLCLYAWPLSEIVDLPFFKAAGIIAGVWVGHVIVRSALRWLTFTLIGKKLTANVILADLQAHSLPSPSDSYELSEWYFDECLRDEDISRKAIAVAAAWRGVFDFVRGTGQFQLLAQLSKALRLAVGRYRIVGANVTAYSAQVRAHEQAESAGRLLGKLGKLTDGIELSEETNESMDTLRAQLAGLAVSQTSPPGLIGGLDPTKASAEEPDQEMLEVAVRVTNFMAELIGSGITERTTIAERVLEEFGEEGDSLDRMQELVEQLYPYAEALAGEDS